MKSYIRFSFIITIFLVLVSITNAQWVKQDSLTNRSLEVVYFYDQNYGWIGGRSNEIFSTNDGGDTWENTNIPNLREVNAFYFIDQNNGWLAGGSVYPDDSVGVYHTTDGGDTWMKENIFTTMFDIDFVNENVGWVGGEEGVIYKTTDGGQNWAMQNSLGWWTWDFEFIDENIGYMNSTSYLYKTTDGGETWVPIMLDTGTAGGLDFYNANVGWTASGYLASQAFIKKTTDGGDSFTSYEMPFYTHDIFFINESSGWVVGSDNNFGFVYRTSDGGETWYQQEPNPDHAFNSVYFLDKDLGWMVGGSGSIYKTTNGGGPVTSVKDNSIVPSNLVLGQNYPNPFNPSTTISYSVPKQSNISLKVYDILGKVVAELVNTEKHAGRYEVNFNAESLSSGIYFYTLKTDNSMLTRKMILIK